MTLTLPQRLAEHDWLDTAYGHQLHHANLSPHDAQRLEDHGLLDKTVLTCGRTALTVIIPGVLTRLSAKRCDRCCNTLGYPLGNGSPKNDPGCKATLRERIHGGTA